MNPRGPAPEVETVTTLNAGPDDVDLAGWSIVDQAKRRLVLDSAALPAGDAVRIFLAPPVQLGNPGRAGHPAGPRRAEGRRRRLHQGQASAEGWSLVF